MRLTKILLATLVVFFLVNKTDAQGRYSVPKKDKIEAGIFLGGTSYSGDLDPDVVNVNHTLFGYGAMLRYNFSNYFSLRVGLDIGNIADDDASSGEHWRVKRNLSFRSPITAGYIVPEIYLAHWRFADKKYVSPYIFAGLGTFHFNPQAQYKGVWYDLRPLGTEGQGTLEYPDRQLYDLNQIYIPFGGGLRITLSQTWFLNVETRIAKTFTDYLDDVSNTYASPDVLQAQNGPIAALLADRSSDVMPGNRMPVGSYRGNPKNMDMFMFTGLTISHTFINKHRCFSF